MMRLDMCFKLNFENPFFLFFSFFLKGGIHESRAEFIKSRSEESSDLRPGQACAEEGG